MFHNDLLIAFSLMGFFFLRQIAILKYPNKINYAPLILGIGAISSVVHFITYTQNTDVLLLIKESLFPLLLAFILYVIMNILHQTQQSQIAKNQEAFTKTLVQEISQLKSFILDMEKRMILSRQEDVDAQEEMRKKFKEDIKALDTIKLNQTTIIDKFDNMQVINEDVNKAFSYFSEVKLPELDDIVHRHIDILRVAEQDHYRKLQTLLNEALENKFNFTDDIKEFKIKLEELKLIANDVSVEIISQTLNKMSDVTKAFENEILLLKSHASSIDTSLSEGETILANIKNQSEMIMKQMILSSKKMKELEDKTNDFSSLFLKFGTVIVDVESIKSDYIKSQSQLSNIVQDVEYSTTKELRIMNKKIDEAIEKIDNYSTKNMNLLAKKAQLKKGYTDLDK